MLRMSGVSWLTFVADGPIAVDRPRAAQAPQGVTVWSTGADRTRRHTNAAPLTVGNSQFRSVRQRPIYPGSIQLRGVAAGNDDNFVRPRELDNPVGLRSSSQLSHSEP